MSLLIHFCEADVGKVTIADSPDPMWDILLGLHALQAPEVSAAVEAWRTRVDLTSTVRGLFRIAPARGYSPDFLTPEQGAAGLDAGLEAIMETGPSRLRAELARLIGSPTMPFWARGIGAGNRDVLRELVVALRAFHHSAMAPYWAVMAECVLDDRRARVATLADAGVAGLLSRLHPLLTWRGSTLELHGDHVNGDLVLGGRGLRLVPSFFCHAVPTVLADPELPPVLVYPIATDVRRFTGGTRSADDPASPLAALLGRTRARMLLAVTTGCTTTELSRRSGVSVASSSYHTSILRGAGLIETTREGSAVRHIITDLGRHLMSRHHRDASWG